MGDFRDTVGMSLDHITEELIARQTPEAQAIIRLLLAKIAELEARLSPRPQDQFSKTLELSRALAEFAFNSTRGKNTIASVRWAACPAAAGGNVAGSPQHCYGTIALAVQEFH